MIKTIRIRSLAGLVLEVARVRTAWTSAAGRFLAERLRVQRSRFTVHGTDPDGLERMGRRPRSHLLRFQIARASVSEMRLDLSTCGIADSTIFPDLEGLSGELARYFNADWFDMSGR
jgi:hypothetical protein